MWPDFPKNLAPIPAPKKRARFFRVRTAVPILTLGELFKNLAIDLSLCISSPSAKWGQKILPLICLVYFNWPLIFGGRDCLAKCFIQCLVQWSPYISGGGGVSRDYTCKNSKNIPVLCWCKIGRSAQWLCFLPSQPGR